MKTFNMIKQLLKKIVCYFAKTEKKQKEDVVFSEITVGSLIFANMPLSKKELLKIPEGHRQRPYYVAYINEDCLIAYPFSSHIRKTSDMNTYMLNHILYPELDKDSYLNLNEMTKLTEENIIRKVCQLKEHDIDKIQRRIYFKDKKAYLSLYKKEPCLSYPIKGDIILYNKNTYFILEDDAKYKLLPFRPFKNRKPISSSIIKLNGVPFLVSFNNEIIIDKNDYVIKHMADMGDYRRIVMEYTKFKKKVRRKHE